MRSPRLGAPGLRPADLLAAALGGRPRPRLAVVAFASAAAADVVLLAGGVLPTRVSTRSAVSRSVRRVAVAARSVSRRASRSLIFVFSALIWSNIVGVVVGMVAFGGFRSIGMIKLGGRLPSQCGIFNHRMCRSILLVVDANCSSAWVLTFRTRAWLSFAPPTCRMPLGQASGFSRAD